jgi:hypothetical protein
MPAYDPGESGPGWCYCRSSGDDSWGYGLDPKDTSTPEQINLQWVSDESLTLAFVTVDGGARGTPTATVATSPSLAGGRTLSGSTNTWTQDAADPREYSFHFVPVDGLLPNTTYYYRVSAGNGAATPSAIYSFTTRDVSQPLSFVFFGDMGTYAHNNMDLLAGERVAFHVHGGDHAYQLSSDGGLRGDGYMIAWEGVLTSKPWLTVIGNHEYYNNALFMRYLNQTAGVAAAPPRSGSTGDAHNGRWYSVDVGLLHFIVLDFNVYYALESDALRLEQVAWLAADLESVDRASTPWVIAAAHMPMQCSSITYDGEFVDARLRARAAAGEDRAAIAASAPYAGCTGTGEAEVESTRKDLEPLFLRYGVDLHLSGHEHNYESTWPSKAGAPVQTDFVNPSAPVYVVEGAGGAPTLDLFGGAAPFTRKQDSSWGYGRITILNASHLLYERIANDICKDSCQEATCPPCPWPAGTVTDSWTLIQGSHGPFEL